MADPSGIIALVVATASYARQTYINCKTCPGEYKNLCTETQQLRCLLDDLEALAEEESVRERMADEIRNRTTGCREVLADLQTEVNKFKSLETQKKRTWDRLKWDKAKVQEIRNRLISNISILNSFQTKLIVLSQCRIESALSEFIAHLEGGMRPAKSVSELTSLGDDNDEQAWPEIVKDLEDFGITSEESEEHRKFILQTLREAKSEIDDSERGSNTGDSNDTSQSNVDKDESETTSRNSDELQYLHAFGGYGSEIESVVRSERSTFRDDLTRSRLYWERGEWSHVKSNLLRVLVSSQLPLHRKTDIDARATAFLLGVAHSRSGDLETANRLFMAVLQPLNKQGKDDLLGGITGPCDDGQIAAATWLGDSCLKTGRIEDAAMAWSLAYDALIRRDKQIGGTRSRINSLPTTVQTRTETLPPSPRVAYRQHSVVVGSSFTRAPSTKISRTRSGAQGDIQIRLLLSEIALVNGRTLNIRIVLEDVESEAYPNQSNNPPSIFADKHLLSPSQMKIVLKQAIEAADKVTEATAFMHLFKEDKGAPDFAMRRKVIARVADDVYTQSLTLPEDYLQSPLPTSRWPATYDMDFSYLAALQTYDYFHQFTTLAGEGSAFGIRILTGRQSRELDSNCVSKPFVSKDLRARKPRDVAKFLELIRPTLEVMKCDTREAPASFRCQPRRDCPHKSWPSIAGFTVNVIGYEVGGFTMANKLAAYIGSVLHWDGRQSHHANNGAVDAEAAALARRFNESLQVRQAAMDGSLLPGEGLRVAMA